MSTENKVIILLIENHFEFDHKWLEHEQLQDSLTTYDNLGLHDCCPDYVTEKTRKGTI